jgi:2-aminoadipate transaminase
MSWEYSDRAKKVGSSIIREILKITLKPGVISFAGGMPAPELFPVKALEEACKRALAQAERSLQYGPSLGYEPLRELIAERYNKSAGTKLTAANVLVTGGSQQGLDLLGRVFLDEGSVVVVSRPTYLGAIQAFSVYGCEYAVINMDNEGMIVSEIEGVLAGRKPRMIYTVPNFQNPSGRTLSASRRTELIGLSKRLNSPIIDDNPYGELRYEGEEVPTLIGLAPEQVIALGTFSKLISPGLRIGWTVASNGEMMDRLERLKQATDLQTNTFAQYVIYEFAKDGALEEHIEKLKDAYRERRAVMVESLAAHMPEGTTWTEPDGGLFLWVELPEGNDAMKLLEKAVEAGVAFVPGSPFYIDGSGKNTFRLNFSNASPEKIRKGIETLGKVIAENA